MQGWHADSQDFPEQKVRRIAVQPVADEVLDVVRQLYDYDLSYPLAPRTVKSRVEARATSANHDKLSRVAKDGTPARSHRHLIDIESS